MSVLVVSGKEVVRVLTKQGFRVVRQRGSHVHLVRKSGSQSFHVTVPVHGNKDLLPFVLRSISRQAGYSFGDFAKLFK